MLVYTEAGEHFLFFFCEEGCKYTIQCPHFSVPSLTILGLIFLSEFIVILNFPLLLIYFKNSFLLHQLVLVLTGLSFFLLDFSPM